MPPGRIAESVAARPSAVPKTAPVPATVEMIPAVSTARTRLLYESATYTVPLGLTATPDGKLSWARAAGPPSPANQLQNALVHQVPLPATVEMMPEVSTLLILWPNCSAM